MLETYPEIPAEVSSDRAGHDEEGGMKVALINFALTCSTMELTAAFNLLTNFIL